MGYKGVWEAKLIPNPKYAPDDKLYMYEKFSSVGIDVWQVKSGTIFDNLLITDDVEYAKTHGEKTWKAQKDGEKKMKEKADEDSARKRRKTVRRGKKSARRKKKKTRQRRPLRTQRRRMRRRRSLRRRKRRRKRRSCKRQVQLNNRINPSHITLRYLANHVI